MNRKKKQHEAVIQFESHLKKVADIFPEKTRIYLLPLFLGVLFAVARRRTVTKWICAAILSEKFRQVFYHIPYLARKSDLIFDLLLELSLDRIINTMESKTKIQIVLDDTTTKRYGKYVEGAGTHHNPTPGKTDSKLCYGHSWVVAAIVLTHPLWGTITLPIYGSLYLRQKEVDKLKTKYNREFKTKLTMAVEIVERLRLKFKGQEKILEVVVDGGYAKEPVLVPLMKMDGVRVVTRFQKNAAFFFVPIPPKKRGRGAPQKYGERINIEGKVACARGWKYVECVQYGQEMKKRTKTFIATSRMTRGRAVKVVIVKEDNGSWLPLVATDVNLSTKEILESYGIRFSIEEMFKDLKEVWGWGKQEVRKLESNEGVTVLNMLMYNLVELCTWSVPGDELRHREDCPWDNPNRRPSHDDRRKFLRYELLNFKINGVIDSIPLPINIRKRLILLLKLAA